MKLDLECKRCGYQWRRKTTGCLPKQCPGCKNMQWNEETVRPRGRPPKEKVVVHLSEIASYPDTESLEITEPAANIIAWWSTTEKQPHDSGCTCTECLLQRGAL